MIITNTDTFDERMQAERAERMAAIARQAAGTPMKDDLMTSVREHAERWSRSDLIHFVIGMIYGVIADETKPNAQAVADVAAVLLAYEETKP